ncbi:hypothetical protein [Microbacterium sp. JB110]|uniref:hypothetical protein n=1 Tax=Microbacterium sp. JB110 TaxID=2024477 RepID=UPI00097F0AF7|nr:hypothetical protein [Microbacterium sp. JB110]RCS61796.1 hypothetical protein CIK77_03525 [Microbacterium sp. JB110]SJM65929.1 hypothetical protein CZ774_14050 [Frigoribacterium sp. JB110]
MNTQHADGLGPEDRGDRADERSPLTEADVPLSVEEIDAALVRLMAETEETVTRLRAELAERRQHEAQHAEIERLEHHLAEATVNWAKVKEFFEEVLRDLIGRRTGTAGPEEPGGAAGEGSPHGDTNPSGTEPGTEQR